MWYTSAGLYTISCVTSGTYTNVGPSCIGTVSIWMTQVRCTFVYICIIVDKARTFCNQQRVHANISSLPETAGVLFLSCCSSINFFFLFFKMLLWDMFEGSKRYKKSVNIFPCKEFI